MKRTVKETLKKWFAGVLAIMIMAGVVGACLPEGIGASKVQAATPTDPAYMAKLTGTSWKYIMQTFGATPGTTYHLTFDYYSDEASAEGKGAKATMWSSGSSSFELLNGVEGSADLTYTVPEGDNWFGIRFELLPDATVYLWNVSVKAEGSDTELLNNGTFEAENGTWIGWTIDQTAVSDKATSDGIKTTYGYEIIPFDKTLLPSGAPPADPAYMAKLTGTSWKYIMQTFGATPGTTYHLTFDYYSDEASTEGKGAKATMWSSGSSSFELLNGVEGSADLTYTVPEGDNWFGIRFELLPDATVYLWNVSVKAEGSDTELLNNGTFEAENGTWIGWTIDQTAVSDKPTSDGIKTTYGYEIIPFDRTLLPSGAPPADPAYMAKLTGTSWKYIMQTFGATPGTTYHLTFDYYSDEASTEGKGAKATMWSSGSSSFELLNGVEGSADVTYTVPAGDSWFGIRFELLPDATVYIWNVSVKAEGSDTELLNNGTFEAENGTWIGWTIDQTAVSDKPTSDGIKTTYGYEIIPFDRTLLPSGSGGGNEPTPPTPPNPSADPAYMAKLTGTSWKYVMQTFGATPGTTYHLTFDYYSDEASTEGKGAKATMWSSGSSSFELLNGVEGSADVTYTVPAGDSWFGIRFELLPNATVYLWNLSVKAEGSDTELLSNGTFEAENGTWIGWTIDQTAVSDKPTSDGIKTTYGYEIIPFDKTLLPSGSGENGPSTPAGPAYMAKLTTTDGKWVMQTFGATVGTKYHLTFDYYADEGSESGFGATATLWAGAESSKQLWNGTTGSVDISFTGDNDWFGMRFVLQPGATVYLWNISVKAEGSDTELLKNGNFKVGNGSWIGWNIDGAIEDKEASDKIVADYKYKIIPYDENVIPDNTEAPGGGDETLTPPVEKIPSGNPKYMAQLNGTYVDKNGKTQEWVWVYQPVTPEAGKTYNFSYQYYVASGQNARGVIWSSSNENGESFTMKSGVQGTANITYKATEKDDWMMIRFECEPGTVCYVWNVCVYETGSDINLLSNGSFNTGDGSWVGWNVKTGITITSKKASDVAIAAYGQKIVRFDSVDLPGETLPDKVPTGDPAYMAKLIGTHIDPDGNLHTYASVYQAITPEAGKTYTFSCEYYDRKANDGAQILLWTDKSGGAGADAYGRFSAKTQSGKEGKLELSYTAKEGETYLVVAMECDPDSEVYMWNMCLREKGSDINLLYNGSFEKEGGTWIGWTSGDLVVATKDESKKLTETYGHEIIAFKRSDIETMKEEDEGLSSYENPNVVFSFDDIEKYKELDCGVAEAESFEQSDMKGFWTSVAGIATISVLGLAVIGGAIGGILWASKKRKSE